MTIKNPKEGKNGITLSDIRIDGGVAAFDIIHRGYRMPHTEALQDIGKTVFEEAFDKNKWEYDVTDIRVAQDCTLRYIVAIKVKDLTPMETWINHNKE